MKRDFPASRGNLVWHWYTRVLKADCTHGFTGKFHQGNINMFRKTLIQTILNKYNFQVYLWRAPPLAKAFGLGESDDSKHIFFISKKG